ncbi:Hypp2019 [Branchiostoma lanceolatum]|uniref:Hypp2019 protein n=1 Tax=Branchiostoma lanceolatum TaxID=7740 RepID=A0A8K0ER40_BRALA|nr:Hypp2019 [Branchiostoma lanceolatum]
MGSLIVSVVLVSLLVFLSTVFGVDPEGAQRRLAVLKTRIPAHMGPVRYNYTAAFRTTPAGTLQFSLGIYGRLASVGPTVHPPLRLRWEDFEDFGSPDGRKVVSNPSVVYAPDNAMQVFVQCADGQVYYRGQNKTWGRDFLPWTPLPAGKLPTDTDVDLTGRDSVSAIAWEGKTVVFARSMTNTSRLYWTYSGPDGFQTWQSLGGDLVTDPSIVYNAFTKYLEAYAIFPDGKVHYQTQVRSTEWQTWRVLGIFPPIMQKLSRPQAHSMSQTIFKGMTEVFAIGTDGHLKHIPQTTCDKVVNPWGYCTWAVWSNVGNGQIPAPLSDVSPLTAGNNVHLGNEIFVVPKDGSLSHVWQLERGGRWHGWDTVGRPANGSAASLPTILQDEEYGGWWEVFVINSNDRVDEVLQNKTMDLSPRDMKSGTALTVSWAVPSDQATARDWIGIYQSGADDDTYLDYRYVQGKLNPTHDIVPKGSVNMTLYLPTGNYQARYLVNKKFVSVMATDFGITDSPNGTQWEQTYRGFAVGLGADGDKFLKCVDDGEQTINKLEDAWQAFEQGKIVEGLQLFGQALKDPYAALVQCGETHGQLAQAVLLFIEDLLECALSRCEHFIIDTAEEVEIWYKGSHEIYGDIRAAQNNLRALQAYVQGGYVVGRVVHTCVNLQDTRA